MRLIDPYRRQDVHIKLKIRILRDQELLRETIWSRKSEKERIPRRSLSASYSRFEYENSREFSAAESSEMKIVVITYI
jgi:hypothetical protein